MTIETIRVARDWLKEQMKGEWETVSESIHGFFPNKASFASSKAQGVGWKTIKTFLGEDWKEWEIQNEIAIMVKEDAF